MARQQNDQLSLRKLSKVGIKSFAVTIPIEIIRQLKMKKGDDILVRRRGEQIIIEKVST